MSAPAVADVEERPEPVEGFDGFDGVNVPKRTRRLFLAVSLIVLGVYMFSAAASP